MKNSSLLVLTLAATAAAQSSSANLTSPVAPELPPAVTLQVAPRIGITSELNVSLSEVLRAVLANNRDVELSRIDRQKASLNLTAAKGAFDPVAGGMAHALRQVNPIASSLGGAVNGAVTQKEIYADPEIHGVSPYLGTGYKLDFSSSRVDNNNTYNTLNPTYPTSATFHLNQPLWGGLLFDTNRERVSVARKDIAQTEQQFRQRVTDTTTQAIRAYLELDYALRNQDIQIEAVRLAEQQDASNRRQVAQGTEAPVDVIQTQAQISNYQQNVFNAQQQVTQAENTLKTLMLPDRTDPLWNVALRTSIPPDSPVPIPTLEDALHRALAERPELKAGKIAVQISELDSRLADERAKPQVTLTGDLGVQGLAGRVVTGSTDIFGTLFTPLFGRVNDLSTLAGLPALPTGGLSGTNSVPGFFVGGYGQSISTLGDGRFPTLRVGIEVEIPIGNRTARAEANLAKASSRQTQTQQQQLEMTIESEVRNGLQQLVNADLRLNAAGRAAQLAQQQYDSEQRQFKAGTSSVFLVLQRQNELITAKLREIRAAADRGEAEADLDRATASTLTRRSIEITAPKAR